MKTLRIWRGLARTIGAISTVAVGLALAPSLAKADTAVKVRTGYTSQTVHGKAAQLGLLHKQVATMVRTLDRNPKNLSPDVVTSLKTRLRAFERAGVKAIEAGAGEMTLWSPRSDISQLGCVLTAGSGASKRYRAITIAASPDSTAVTEATTGSGRATLKENQLVAKETWFKGGGQRHQQTSLWTFATYPGGGVTHGTYEPRQGRAAGTERTAAAPRPYFGSTLKETGKEVVVSHFVQPRDQAGKFAPGRRVLTTDSASKKGLTGSWASAQRAVSAATKNINTILRRGEGATVTWEKFDQQLETVLNAINRAEDSVRDGADIFAGRGGAARPARMTELLHKGNLTLQSLGRARGYVNGIYESVHDKLGFMAAAKLSTILGDASAPMPRPQGQVPAWAIKYLEKAASELGVAKSRMTQGATILSRNL